jgi:peptidyl-tRNA hydrolase, PTH1 family
LAVGLGNPGAEYAGTRHNLGADVVTRLATRHGARMRLVKGQRSLVAEVRPEGRLMALAFPQTYVNESGTALRALVRRYGLDDLSHLVVVYDEMDLPVGKLKISLGGGTAGHKGLASIRSHLHDDGFARVRIGIGPPPGRDVGADYVLRPPSKSERPALDVLTGEAADAVEVILSDGVDAAMNRFNVNA